MPLTLITPPQPKLTLAERAMESAKQCASSNATPMHWHLLMTQLENLALIERQHAAVRAAVLDHHRALDRRAHGSTMTAIRLAEAVCKALGMPWVRGSTLREAVLDPEAAPLAVCSQCGRKTWETDEVGDWCNMSQPGGTRCPGLMTSSAAS